MFLSQESATDQWEQLTEALQKDKEKRIINHDYEYDLGYVESRDDLYQRMIQFYRDRGITIDPSCDPKPHLKLLWVC